MRLTEENSLICDILDGETEMFAVLVNRYQRPIFNLLLRMTGNEEDAADLTQETFLKAYEKLERFRLSKRFFPWLYTIGMNLARDHLRKRKSAAKAISMNLPFEECASVGLEENCSLAQRLDASRLMVLLAQLPEDYREAVLLRYHEGLTMKEIGEALKISTSGAKMRVKRALERLRASLKLN